MQRNHVHKYNQPTALFIEITEVENIDSWSPKMKAPMIEMYGEPYFRQTWSSWCRLFQEIYEKEGGDLCKEDVKTIKCPTLIIHGMKDAMVPFEHAQHLHKSINNSK
jgi:valacyclovir hydrolase